MTALPTIHRNGTSAESLRDEYHEVHKALQKVEELLAKATCHPRDFYPQDVIGGEGGWLRARKERTEAFNHLAEVSSYVEDWLVHCSDECDD
jgi:hypothetical protein